MTSASNLNITDALHVQQYNTVCSSEAVEAPRVILEYKAVTIPAGPTLWQRIAQRFKELMCAILRHKCVLDVTIRQEHEGGLQPWRIRCVSCGAINPFKRG